MSINWSQQIVPTRQLLCSVAGAVLIAVTGCGGQTQSADPGSSQTVPPGDQPATITVTLSAASDHHSEKHTVGSNLLDLSERWYNWSGSVSQVYYDPVADTLRLPAVAVAVDPQMVLGVRRFDQPLTEGTQYRLSVLASNPKAAAVLFLFDRAGTIVAVAGDTSDGLAYARDNSPITFTAPANVAGFYLQVQNGWQVYSETMLSAELRGTANGSVGDNLVDPQGPWPDWAGAPSAVTYDSATEQLIIQPPAGGQGNSYGVRRFDTPLTEGAQYELAVDIASDPNAAVLLFLIDGNGQIVPFAGDSDGSMSAWLAARQAAPQTFTAPTGITGFAIQVQSAWQATQVTTIAPALREAGNLLACKPVVKSLSVAVPSEGGFFPDGQPAISDDGNFVVFASSFEDLIAGETDPNGQFVDIFLFNRIAGKTERVTPGTGGGQRSSVCPCAISADGQTVAFMSTDPNLIDGEVDANGEVRDIFVYGRQTGHIERVTPGTGLIDASFPRGTGYTSARMISADGQRIVFEAHASDLIPGAVSRSDTAIDLMIYDRSNDSYTRVTPQVASGASNGANMSANGRYVAFASEAPNLIGNEIDVNGSNTDIFRYDYATEQIERVTLGTSPGTFVRPSISGDGQIIVFDGNPASAPGTQSNWDVFEYDFSGGGLKRLTTGQPVGAWNIDATLSANGRAVAFRQVFGAVPVNADEIVLYHRASGASTSVLDGAFASSPTLSADGSVLAYRGKAPEGDFGVVIGEIGYPCQP